MLLEHRFDKMIEIFKLLICLPFLFYGCYTDILTRKVSNKIFLGMLILSFPFIIMECAINGFEYIRNVILVVIFVYLLMYAFFRLNLFGGADAKSLIIIGCIFPFSPIFSISGVIFPIFGVPTVNIFAINVFIIALISTFILPFIFLLYNLITLPTFEVIMNPLFSITGYKTDIKNVKNSYLKILEKDYEKMTVKKSKFWVTPGIPFLVPITIGFITLVIFGSIL